MEQYFISLCYHYIRPEVNPFPKILGNEINEFQNHLKMLQQNYSLISPDDVLNFYHSDQSFTNSKNVLLTFDDGLVDQYEAAKILQEQDMKAIFFIPTCILDEKLPANSMIIHYCIAEFGVANFLNMYHDVLEELKLKTSDNKDYVIQYNKDLDNVWDKINQIKNTLKYKMGYMLGRKVLIKIFENLFLPKFPKGLDMIHLDENKVRSIIKMGHTIGTHTHTHVSVAATRLNSNDFEKEVIYPKKFLEKKFGIEIFSFCYPFGEKQDWLSSSELLAKTNEYEIAFTIEEIKNTKNSSPLQLGRYSPRSTDNAEKLSSIIERIINN